MNQPIIKPTRVKKQRIKKRTLIEFKNWINGLSEFREDGWHPDVQQWRHIQDSINSIIESQHYEESVPQPTYSQPLQEPAYNAPMLESNIPQYPQHPSSSFDGSNHPTHVQSSLEQRLKSDIDTSDGNYTSEFE